MVPNCDVLIVAIPTAYIPVAAVVERAKIGILRFNVINNLYNKQTKHTYKRTNTTDSSDDG